MAIIDLLMSIIDFQRMELTDKNIYVTFYANFI